MSEPTHPLPQPGEVCKNHAEFATQWYQVDEIAAGIQRQRSRLYDGDKMPTDVYSREFAEWLTNQYRLAMAKGMQLARRLHPSPDAERVRELEPLRIVRAAIRDDLGGIHSVPIPGRHCDVIREMRDAGYTGGVNGEDQQGFLLSDGRFCRRKAARHVAEKAGQLKNGKTISGQLTSEDLW